MKNFNNSEPVITGVGIVSSIGQGKEAFSAALLAGESLFGVMKRPGRQQQDTAFIGAEIPNLQFQERLSKRLLRTASLSSQAALVALCEAWEDADLDSADPQRIGLIVGGSNFQQREMVNLFEGYRERLHLLRPAYGMSFMDSDLCGHCTEQFAIRGLAYTVGGASASGQLAVVQAIEAVMSGQVDICIALGALTDLSYMECQALRFIGAMGSDRFADQPELACRPFDQNRDGFIYGESCGAVVIERAKTFNQRQCTPYVRLAGWGVVMDGNRNPNPTYEGEVYILRKALMQAGILPQEVDYINPHGTGSIVGDEIELRAIKDCGLFQAYINATKSLIGHGLSAAGTVELIAVILQMKESRIHPTRNLEQPIDEGFNWVKSASRTCSIRYAVNMSMGFGGINTAICLENLKYEE